PPVTAAPACPARCIPAPPICSVSAISPQRLVKKTANVKTASPSSADTRRLPYCEPAAPVHTPYSPSASGSLRHGSQPPSRSSAPSPRQTPSDPEHPSAPPSTAASPQTARPPTSPYSKKPH